MDATQPKHVQLADNLQLHGWCTCSMNMTILRVHRVHFQLIQPSRCPDTSDEVFWMKTSACRDGTLKPTKLEGNDTTTLSHHPTSCVILPPLTQICFVCLLVVCRRLWKEVWQGAGTGRRKWRHVQFNSMNSWPLMCKCSIVYLQFTTKSPKSHPVKLIPQLWDCILSSVQPNQS